MMSDEELYERAIEDGASVRNFSPELIDKILAKTGKTRKQYLADVKTRRRSAGAPEGRTPADLSTR
jgi:hypothetical protein